MDKRLIEVKNMTCVSCEHLLEEGIKEVKGVFKVRARAKKGQVLVLGQGFSTEAVLEKITELGYQVGPGEYPFWNRDKRVWLSFGISILLLVSLIGLFRFLGISIPQPSLGSDGYFGAALLMGVVAGFSTCMALVGGLVLGISAKFAEAHPEVDGINKFKPHILFNLGRITSFFFLGGLLGLLGSVVKINGFWVGVLTLLVAIVLFILGIQLTEISPKIRFGFKFPGFKRKQKQSYSRMESLLLGGATFFLPCGFTQAMQIFAISTGSFWPGALVMSLFALGTAPALLGIGGLVSFMKRSSFTKYFFRFVGVVLVVFALYNLSNGSNLVGLKNIFIQPQRVSEKNTEVDKNKWGQKLDKARSTAVLENGIQVLRGTYDVENVLVPEDFEVSVNKPVRVEIFAKDDGEGCMGSVLIPGLFDQYQLFVKDQITIMEFTPKKAGNYLITCAMGVPAGTLKVR